MAHALVAAAIAVVLVACAGPDATPTPTRGPTARPTAAAGPTATTASALPGGAETAELRERAEAFAVALTEARYDDSYAMTSPAFQAACSAQAWFGGLVAESSILRALAGLHDDAFLEWSVVFVEASGDVGSVVMSASHAGRPVNAPTAVRWTKVKGVWRFDAPAPDVCV